MGRRRWRGPSRQYDGDPRVEGLLVRYLHFYGDMDTIAVNRRWYRREVRAVRLDPALDIRPYQGAQGFRVGPETPENPGAAQRRGDVPLRLGPSCAGPAGQARGQCGDLPVVPGARVAAAAAALVPGLTRFQGSHPATARTWVDARRDDAERRVEAPHFRTEFLRYYLSDAIERLTGARIFEFRNYTLV